MARLAGVSKGTLYLYYPSKDELFKAVVRTYLGQFIVEVPTWSISTRALLPNCCKTWPKPGGLAWGNPKLQASSVDCGRGRQFPRPRPVLYGRSGRPCHALLGRAVHAA